MRKLYKYLRNEEGSALIESAFALPIIFLTILSIIVFGMFYWIQSTLQSSVEAAGRYTMLNISATDAQIISAAQANLSVLPTSAVTFTVTPSTVSGINYKTIDATYSFASPASYINIENLAVNRKVTVPLVQ